MGRCSYVAKWKNVNNAIKWSKFCRIIYQSRKDFPFNEDEDYYYTAQSFKLHLLNCNVLNPSPIINPQPKKSPQKSAAAAIVLEFVLKNLSKLNLP